MKFRNSFLRASSLFLGCAIAVGALIVLTGWLVESVLIVQLYPSFAPMQFNTALCFLLISLAIIGEFSSKNQKVNLSIISATLLCFSISVATALQYLFDIDLVVDTLFVYPFTEVQTSHPGRMAPNTCIAFILMSLSLAISHLSRKYYLIFIAGTCCMGSLLIAGVGLVGYSTGFIQGYGWKHFTSMALHTAVFFIALCTSMVLYFEPKFQKSQYLHSAWHAFIAFVLGSFLSITLWFSSQSMEIESIQSELTSDAKLHTVVIQGSLDGAVNLLKSVERFFAGSTFVSEEEFKLFTLPLLSSSQSIVGIDWAPKTESKPSKNQLVSFEELNTASPRTSRKKVSLRFPVTYTEPFKENQLALGFDHHSDPIRHNAMQEAIRSGEATATNPLTLFRKKTILENPEDFLLVVPFLSNNNSIDDPIVSTSDTRVKGFIIGAFRTSELIERALSKLPTLGLEIDIRFQEKNGVKKKLWKRVDKPLHEVVHIANWSPLRNALNIVREEVVTIGRRKLFLKFKPLPEYVQSHSSNFPTLVFLLSLFATIITAIYIYTLRLSQNKTSLLAKEKDIALAAIREREELFYQLSSKATIGIYRTDNEGNCVYVNEAWSEIAGVSQVEALGDGWIDTIHPEDWARVSEEWNALITGERDFELTYRFLHKNGKSRWVSSKAVPVRGHKNEIVGYVGTNSDITILKRQAEALQSATESKGRFLANMSHEIRTPLTAIIGYSDILLKESPDKEAANEAVQTISTNCDHLLSLINDVLDFSKIEEDKLSVAKEEFDLFDVISEIQSTFKAIAEEKNIELMIKKIFPLPNLINSDKMRFKQILINLVGNAVKFTANGNVTLIVSYDKYSLSISVKDTGPGMSEALQKKLFRPFEQGDTSTTKMYGGTGLGLAISRKLAILMGGNIDLISVPGSGSTFTLSFKKESIAPVQIVNSEIIKSKKKTLSKAQQYSGKVLLADDIAINRKLLNHLLSAFGLEITEAQDGKEAIEALKSDNFDIVLLDMLMPIMDGFEVASLIRSEGNAVPIIAVTAEGSSEGRVKCLDSGCDEVLAKPFRREELEKLLSRYLGKSS